MKLRNIGINYSLVMSKLKSLDMSKLMDIIFIGSSIIFNVLVSFLYIATKLENLVLQRALGRIILFLIIPFTITLSGYIKEKEERKTIISLVIILFYLFLELLLDYILLIPFREILVLHIPYIVIFYAAAFCMIGVSFDKNKKMGFIVLVTFFVLLGCLIYMYIG